MRYSLMVIHREVGDKIDGVWIQDSTGTLEKAILKARATEAANSHRIAVAVVEGINGAQYNYNLIKGLTRLG